MFEPQKNRAVDCILSPVGGEKSHKNSLYQIAAVKRFAGSSKRGSRAAAIQRAVYAHLRTCGAVSYVNNQNTKSPLVSAYKRAKHRGTTSVCSALARGAFAGLRPCAVTGAPGAAY